MWCQYRDMLRIEKSLKSNKKEVLNNKKQMNFVTSQQIADM